MSWNYWNATDLIKQGVLEIGDGYRAKNSEMGETGLPFARAGNINGGFHFEDADLLCEESVAKAGGKVSRSGDVTFTSKGTFGRFAYVSKNTPKFVYSPQLCYWRVLNPELIDQRFLYYWMQGDDCMNQLHQIKGLTDMADYVSLSNQRKMRVSAPVLETQRKIASTLSVYDDLIENNTRRIKILEEMARMIYREWFVNFRFPGHEQVKMVDSLLGMIPEGWGVKTVQDTFEILGGGTPSTKEPTYWESGAVNWYSPTDLTSKGTMFMDESATKITQLGLQKSSARLFPVFSVMMTSRATLGVIAINTTAACTNQGFITCIPNERFPLYTLYFWLRENVDQFISLASGATFKEITKGVFKAIELAVPPAELVCRFEVIAGSIGKQLLNLQKKNQNLRQTRDLLLPKLISGEVEVSMVNCKSPPAPLS